MSLIRNLFIAISLLVICSQQLSADITTYDNVFSTNDVYSSDFSTRLNRNFNQSLTGGINNITATNIVNDTILEADMADEINPRIRTYEGASCEYVDTGLLPATSANLTSNISLGVAYPRGYRINKASATSRTYTASRWTFVDIDINGDFQYSEVTIGAATPSVAANSVRLARVSTDATQILSVQDIRVTSCTSGPFNIIRDASGEATLEDIVKYGSGGWLHGLGIVTNDSTSVTVQPGTAYINGKYRTLTANTSPSISTTATPGTSVSGIDTGSVAASTTYYLYAVADESGVSPSTFVYSTNVSSPSGMTNYRRFGQVTTTSGSSLATNDVSAISYIGKIRQIRYSQFGHVLTGATNIPDDDSVPQNNEGEEIFKLDIAPVSARNLLKFNWIVHMANSGNTQGVCALFKDSSAGALAASKCEPNAAGVMCVTTGSFITEAGSVSNQSWKLRCGFAATTTTINGEAGSRLLGGSLMSSLRITEYER